MSTTPASAGRVHPARVEWLKEGAPASGARYVLYWIQINQRAVLNDALDFAVRQADALGLPLIAYQGLRPDYPGANDRIHTFILEGAIGLRRALAAKGIRHLFHLERRPSAAAGLLAALARSAALIVTDAYPVFIVPRQSRALARQITRPLAAVDASCIVPYGLFPRAEYAARTIRPKLHRLLPEHLRPRKEIAPARPSLGLEVPFPFPRGGGLEAEERTWLDLGRAEGSLPQRILRVAEWVRSCAINHSIAPSPVYRGGEDEARARLETFVTQRLASYPADRNDPSREGTSHLSPYLHFGQISALEVALRVLAAQTEPPGEAPPSPAGESLGRVLAAPPSPAGESLGRVLAAPDSAAGEALGRVLAAPDSPAGAFLEQLIVRRELAFNFCARTLQHSSIEGLPSWARRTLDEHALDRRAIEYDPPTLEWSETDDPVWNAAQSELRLTGVIHNRLRMLWGKKILEWCESPAEAVRVMIDLHDRYALDGRDPNTYANILWCLGLHDRPFGPARPITGTVRPMSTDVARKKLDLDAYVAALARYES